MEGKKITKNNNNEMQKKIANMEENKSKKQNQK